jgi:hypothetical protein
MTSVENPGSHTHLPTTVDGQQVCMSCNVVLIQPLLTTEAVAKANTISEEELWARVVDELRGSPADFILIELSDASNPPNYIRQLMEHYGDSEPPHVRTLRWWND